MIKKLVVISMLLALKVSTTFALLPTPLLTSPASSSTGNQANTIINWYNVTGATSYEFKFNTHPLLAGALLQTSTSSQFLNSNLLFGTTYYWQVRALKTTGTPDTSAWTQIFNFTTLNSLTVTSPQDGSLNEFPKIYLNWGNATGIIKYEVQLDNVATFNSSTRKDSVLPDSLSACYFTGLDFGKLHFWRVRAIHSADTTDWTNSTFTTIDTVFLSSPSNGSSFLSPEGILFNWNYISGILNYEVEWDTTAYFNSPNLQTSILPDSLSEIAITNLFFATNYYWRVRAWHGTDTTQWSQVWNFSTLVSLTLSAPIDNGLNQFPNVLLNWNYISGQINYDVELDTSSNFNSTLYLYNTNDSISEFKTNELLFGTKYYWRVRAHNDVDTAQWSSTWSFTTLDSVNRSYPLSGAIAVPTRVTLDWDAVEGSDGYNLLVDTLPNYTSSVARNLNPPASAMQISNLFFGTKYFWKLNAYHQKDTSLWTSNWEFTTATQVSLGSPSDNSINISPRVNLNWANLNGSLSYLVEYDTSQTFSSSFLKSVTVTTSGYLATNLYFNQKYYWRVKAINLVDTSDWSQVWNFTTMNQLLHTSPINGAIGQALTTQINWSGVSGAIGYIYRFDTSPLFNVFPQSGNSIGTNSRADITLPLYGQTYYWQVAVFDSVDTSAWSNPWSFTTLYQLANGPLLISPANLANGVATSAISFTWNLVAGAFGYEYALSTDSNFTNANIVNALDTSVVINNLANLTSYFWRVRAANANGYSPWSAAFEFTTLNPFTTAPLLFAPEDLATDVPQPVTFSWMPVNFATSYECEYDLDSTFSTAILLSGSDTFAVSTVLDPLQTYYWRVRGLDGNAYSPWSNSWTFTTENPLTIAPVLIAPADGLIAVTSPANFSWKSLDLASSYECEYDTDSLFSSPILLISTDTTIISLPLNPLTNYFWRARGVLGNVSSPWSTVWSFTTENPLTIAPLLSLPANGASSVQSPCVFVWFPISSASSYECVFSWDSLFSPPTVLIANDTSVVSPPLAFSSKYFWKVRGVLAGVYSPWSAVWSFTTTDGTTPIQLLPAKNDTGLMSPVTFKWAMVSTATDYECAYSTDSTFNNAFPSISTFFDTAVSFSLLPLTNYYWKVRAFDGPLAYSWSPVWKFTTSLAVAVKKIRAGDEFSIYPNPASDKVTFSYSNNPNRWVTIQLISSKGEVIWIRKQPGNVNESVDLSNLSKGIYTIKVQDDKNVSIKKLIVK